MDFYYMLVDLFADEEPFSYFISLALTVATAFSAFVSMNRSNEYIKSPDIYSFDTVKKSARLLNGISILLYQWCIFAAVYLLIGRRGSVGTVYFLICLLAGGAVVFSVISKNRYTKAKNINNALYLKANKGNLSAIMGNPLGLQGHEQDALNSILTAGGKYAGSANSSKAGGTVSDPLNDMLTGAAPIEKNSPAKAAVENLEQTRGEELRECPFCKRQVEKKYPICIYCGKLIPDREKDYRKDSMELSGWERVDR